MDLQTSSPRVEPSFVSDLSKRSSLRHHSQGQSRHRRRRKPRRGGRGSVGRGDQSRVLGRAGKPKTHHHVEIGKPKPERYGE
uniref:Uncharacterized protein n=1 Tax=Fagus sylvatica TaxID=28930 RepID=A0A2N9GMK1_FAGSY